MTLPTITYGVHWQTDCDDTTGWNETEDGNTATLTVDSGTIFNIEVTVSAGNKSVYYELNLDNTSSATYPEVYILYKTSDASIKAKVSVILTGAGEEVVLSETSNTDWTLASATLTLHDTIDKIRIYATQATGDVYFHWLMIYKGTVTPPNFKRILYDFPVKIAKIPIPGRDTDILQHLGRDNAKFTIEGDMQSGETWGSKTGANADSSVQTFGEYLYYVLRERKFQWLTTDLGNFKVMPDPTGFSFGQEEASGQQRTYRLKFIEYEAGDTSASTFDDPTWYGEDLT